MFLLLQSTLTQNNGFHLKETDISSVLENKKKYPNNKNILIELDTRNCELPFIWCVQVKTAYLFVRDALIQIKGIVFPVC